MPEELMCIRQSADVTIIDVNEYLGSYAVAELRKPSQILSVETFRRLL